MQATIPSTPGLLSRRPMDLEDHLGVVRRHLGWILGPVLAGLTIAVVVAHLWGDTYASTAAIRVVPPTVPEKYVPTNTSMQMAERIEAMKQTILSRQTLTNIIETFDLYSKDREKLPMQDIIEKMVKDIMISSPHLVSQSANSAFFISFSYSDRYTAQRVMRDLMTRFIDENLRQRERESQQTTQFLKDQYEAAKLELNEVERRLTQWKMENIDRLPETLGVSVSQMGAIEARVATLNSSVGRARQEQAVLEAELRAMREKLNSIRRAPMDPVPGYGAGSPGGSAADGETALARVDKEIQTLERGLVRMLEQYTPTYPDVQRLQSRIQTLKRERDGQLDQKLTVSPAGTPAPESRPTGSRMTSMRAREIAEIEAAITRLHGQVQAKEMEAERYLQDIASADRRSRVLGDRLSQGPIGAVQQEQLLKEYDLVQKRHDEIRNKYIQSVMANEIESRKQGETLEVLENPSLPERPTAPNRLAIIAVGTMLGVALGAALALVRETKDTSLKSLKDVRAYTQFNILGSIPLLENDFVVRRRRLAVVGWTAAGVVSLIAMAAAVYYHHTNSAM